jgi:hypothetical protein
VTPRLEGAGERIPECMVYPLFPRGVVSGPKPCCPSPPLLAQGGGGGMVRTDPSHSLSGTRCPTHPPWGVGIRLVQKGLSRQPRVHDLGYGVGLLSGFALFLFARGIPVSDGIPEW